MHIPDSHRAWWRSVRTRLVFTLIVCASSLSILMDWPVNHHIYHVATHRWDASELDHMEPLQYAEYFNTSRDAYPSHHYNALMRHSKDPASVFKALLSDRSSDAGVAYGLFGLAKTDPDYFLQIAHHYEHNPAHTHFPVRYGTYCEVEEMSFASFIAHLRERLPTPR